MQLTEPLVRATAYEHLLETYRQLYGWDRDTLDTVGFLLGCYLSPSLPRNVSQVWAMLVGPASCGKSSLFKAYRDLPWTVSGDNLTENAMSSASVKGQGRNYSLLNDLCEETEPVGSKVWMIPEFSTIAMSSPLKIGKFFADLRHVYDGRYVNRSGAHGAIEYKIGRAGFLAAYTKENFVQQNNVLGERLLLFRMFRRPQTFSDWDRQLADGLPPGDPLIPQLEDRAAKLTGTIIHGAREAINTGVVGLPSRTGPNLRFISALGKLGSMLRSFPDEGKSSDPEAPYRLTQQLASWADSFCVATGRPLWDEDCFRILRRMVESSATRANLELIHRLWGNGADHAVIGAPARQLTSDLRYSTQDEATAQLRQWVSCGLLVHRDRRHALVPEVISLIDETSILESV